MILQTIMDLVSELLALLIDTVPPLPPEIYEQTAQISASSAYLGGLVAKFGAVVPWDTAENIVLVWVTLVGIWGASVLVRALVWAVGR